MRKHKINITIFAITAVVLALLIPTNGMFSYSYKLGDVWSDNTVIAPFDFPVLKSDQEYKADIDKFKKTYQSVYSRDLTTRDKRLSEMRNLYRIDSSYLKMRPASLNRDIRYKGIAYNTISKIFERGIIDNTQLDNGDMVIRIITDDNLRVTNRASLSTPSQALEQLKEAIDGAPISMRNDILNIAERYLTPDIIYVEEIDDHIYNRDVSKISAIKGYIREGAVVVNSGDIINDDKYTILESFRLEYANRGVYKISALPLLANLFFASIVLILSFFSLLIYDKEFLESSRRVLFLMMLYVGFTLMAIAITKIKIYPISVYVIPFAIFPIYINHFFGSKISLYQYIFVLLIVSLISGSSFQLLLINYLAGVAGMHALQRATKRGNLIRAAGVTLLVSVVVYSIVSFMDGGKVENIAWESYIWFIINAILLVALYQMIFPIEKIFKFVSNVTLIELNDTNHKLLREMATKAPGTYQHVMQVANLSEAAAKAIGANPLLARAGALYHDIGKMENPKYFIENNKQGEVPHDKLSALQSAEIIREHVSNGLKIARRHNIPNAITDFITTHHGNSLIYFFFKKYQEEIGEENIDETLFRYNGSTPNTKETTICMMADSIEAASRTLKEYTPEAISELVESIVTKQESNRLFIKSPLTFADMERVKKAFKEKLSNIYHTRVEYPK